MKDQIIESCESENDEFYLYPVMHLKGIKKGPSGPGKYLAGKMFAVQPLLWSLAFLIQQILKKTSMQLIIISSKY